MVAKGAEVSDWRGEAGISTGRNKPYYKPAFRCLDPECPLPVRVGSQSGVCKRHMHGEYCTCKACETKAVGGRK